MPYCRRSPSWQNAAVDLAIRASVTCATASARAAPQEDRSQHRSNRRRDTRRILGRGALGRSAPWSNIERQGFGDQQSDALLADMTNFPDANEACLATGKVYLHAASRALLYLDQPNRVHARYPQAVEAPVSRYSHDGSSLVARHRYGA